MFEEDEVGKYKKKKNSNKSKSRSKSKHKHDYEEVLLIYETKPHYAHCCKLCGKIDNMHLFETCYDENRNVYISLNSEEIFDKYAKLKRIHIESLFQKYIPIEIREDGE